VIDDEELDDGMVIDSVPPPPPFPDYPPGSTVDHLPQHGVRFATLDEYIDPAEHSPQSDADDAMDVSLTPTAGPSVQPMMQPPGEAAAPWQPVGGEGSRPQGGTGHPASSSAAGPSEP
jgi:hypothetical protein